MTDLLILGTGSLAHLFGYRISSAGFSVTLAGTWKEGIKAVNRAGIRYSAGAETAVCPMEALSIEQDNLPVSDQALILVKSWQTSRTAHLLESILTADGVALTLQNGLGNKQILCRRLGEKRTAQGVTTTGATLEGPGKVRLGGEGVVSVESHPRIEPLVQMMEAADFTVRRCEDLSSLIWDKMIINSAINPVTALLRVTNGAVDQSPEARSVMGAAAKETRQVALAEGARPEYDDPLGAVLQVARATAQNRSSMLQDILRGAPTEIDAICGAVVRIGERHGIPTPVNRALYQLIKAAVETKEINL